MARSAARSAGQGLGREHRSRRGAFPVQVHRLVLGVRQLAPGRREPGVFGDGLLVEIDRLLEAVEVVGLSGFAALHVQFIGLGIDPVGRRRARGQTRGQRHLGRDLPLQQIDLVDRPFELAGPDLLAAGGLGQLGDDVNPVLLAPHGTGEDERGAELLRGLRRRGAGPGQGETGSAGHDLDPLHARDEGDQLVGDRLGEIGLRGAQVVEAEHGQAGDLAARDALLGGGGGGGDRDEGDADGGDRGQQAGLEAGDLLATQVAVVPGQDQGDGQAAGQERQGDAVDGERQFEGGADEADALQQPEGNHDVADAPLHDLAGRQILHQAPETADRRFRLACRPRPGWALPGTTPRHVTLLAQPRGVSYICVSISTLPSGSASQPSFGEPSGAVQTPSASWPKPS